MERLQSLDSLVATAEQLEADTADPAALLVRVYELQIALCDMLEQIADCLPAKHDRSMCARLSGIMVPLLNNIHRFEEAAIYPAVMAGGQQTPTFATTIDCFRKEHSEDEFRAEELAETLLDLSREAKPANPEAAGYLLRSMFEAVRRHCSHELEYLSHFLADAEQRKPN